MEDNSPLYLPPLPFHPLIGLIVELIEWVKEMGKCWVMSENRLDYMDWIVESERINDLIS